ncbi:MAG TPA: hypothetical protein VJ144_03790, partial [Candidatus Polarisedimenticolia bacterium]|nr:hypothetical protein [Candidatus Polarisedimenticolia bacterium]
MLRAWRGFRPAASGAFARLPPLALAADLGSAPGGWTFALTLGPTQRPEDRTHHLAVGRLRGRRLGPALFVPRTGDARRTRGGGPHVGRVRPVGSFGARPGRDRVRRPRATPTAGQRRGGALGWGGRGALVGMQAGPPPFGIPLPLGLV